MTEEQPTSKDITTESSYWNLFYAKFNISNPSQFCVMTAVEADVVVPIVEFGCGNGRDSAHFARHGHTVYACDLSKPAIKKDSDEAKSESNLQFKVVDASDTVAVKGIVDEAKSPTNVNNVLVYTRFFLHSIDETQQSQFFKALSTSLVTGDKLYFEYRSAEDETLHKVHGKGHYRRYIETPDLMKELENLGFKIEYEITGRGMAKYKQEDPFVSRVIASKV